MPFAFLVRGHAQAGRRVPGSTEKKSAPPPAEAKPAETPAPPKPSEPESASDDEDVDDGETVTVDTNLVKLPVVANDRGGRYVPDLKAEDFTVSEDGAEQKVAFFATVTEPFSVVLMIDTSASTTVEKLRQVQDAAVAFTEQLRPGDRVKVISFDDELRDLSDFTGDRAVLAAAIRSTRQGKGTRLYDAFDRAYRALRRVKGRKAVIMLTDGLDYYSAERTYDDNRRAVEESDIVVYPVRFDTRAETEQLMREQASGGGGTIDLGTILGGRVPGTKPGTVVIKPRGGSRRPEDEGRRPDGMPDVLSRRPDDRTGPTPPPRTKEEAEDASIRSQLDLLYRTADDYLNEMARTTGGRLVRADNPLMLPSAFRQIAEELGTQYSLGYYPTNSARDGKYRKVRVRTTRKDVALRTRPGYRARR
ncbi:MAG TPA: VWA domain-containing protein [Pyrinomonadaceae bacterium]